MRFSQSLLLCAALLTSPLTAAGASLPPPRIDRAAEIREKEARLRALLVAEQLDGVVIGTQRNFAWLTAGGDNHVVYNTEEGAALLLWTPEAKYVVTANNELARFMDEELAGLGYAPAPFSWHKDITDNARARLVTRLAGAKRLACDLPTPLPGTVDIGAKLAGLRTPFVAGEVERYRWLARTAAEVVESTARELQRGQTEREVQAIVARKLFTHDILPTVLLVAADDRIAKYKHPITKEAVVRREAMITLCARKWGMVVAVTRHIYFGDLPPEISRRQEALGRVFAAMLAATRPGEVSGAVVAAARRAYSEAGYADGWEAHHLGGALGYRERDYKAAPGTTQPILAGQAFAWNPTLAGVKAEDTVLLTGGTLEFLTDTGQWPRVEFTTDGRRFRVPQILVRR